MALSCVLFAACSFDTSGTSGDGLIDSSVTDAEPSPDAMPANVVDLLSTDPFADATPASFIAGFNDSVCLGPNFDGTTIACMNAAGDNLLTATLTFPEDVTGSSHTNSSGGPYAGIGYTGCITNDDCGPDNENGRGFLSSVTLGGSEWLVMGGAHSGDLDYIYMSNAIGTTMEFLYVDVGILGGSTKGTSAVHQGTDRFYVGFPDTGGSQPYLIEFATAPTSPGLNAVDLMDVFDLGVTGIAGFDTGGTSIIDALTDHGGLLYMANDGAWVRSNIALPRVSDHWDVVTPDSTDYTDFASVVITKTADILPEDRSVVSFAEYRGRVFAARNTTNGPQLWRCNTAGGPCDSGNWTLIARDSGPDALSRFDNPNNVSIGMFESTVDHLYVGFNNNVDGVVVYRTAATNPSSAEDFDGDDDCTAGTGCPGLGGNGLGEPAANTKFLDSEAISFDSGVTSVYALTGTGANPLRLFRFAQ